eukprot:6198490-Pleurochrysis_carterae.AAC.4
MGVREHARRGFSGAPCACDDATTMASDGRADPSPPTPYLGMRRRCASMAHRQPCFWFLRCLALCHPFLANAAQSPLTNTTARRLKQQASFIDLRASIDRAKPVQSATVATGPEMRTFLTACLFEHVKNPAPFTLKGQDQRATPMRMSDKCASHAYHYAYTRYIMPLVRDFQQGTRPEVRILEIGLGCGQSNTGAGVRMWDSLFVTAPGVPPRQLTLHVLEYDGRCAEAWKARWEHKFKHVNLTIFVGSQSDAAVLSKFGDGYDAIIDDGGHRMDQQKKSLEMLFTKVKPGGWYCIEDLQSSYMQYFGGRGPPRRKARRGVGGWFLDKVLPARFEPQPAITVDLIKQIIGWIHGDPTEPTGELAPYAHILPLIEHVDCYTELCVLQRYPLLGPAA